MRRDIVRFALIGLLLLAVPPAAAQTDDPFRSAAPPAPPPPPRPRPAPREPEAEPAVAIPKPAEAPRPLVREGDWEVSGPGIPNSKCGPWAVRIAVSQGRLSGTVKVKDGSQPLQNLTLQPDGSFSGFTAGGSGLWGGRQSDNWPIFTVTGRFSGDTISVALRSGCSNLPRTGDGKHL